MISPWSCRRTRIIPAYAGSTNPGAPCACRKPDHPRIRGEHQRHRLPREICEGSSPHTRGALVLQPGRLVELGIIPAYAGSTQSRKMTQASRADHPRIRGEHRLFRQWIRRRWGSSPHTRGARDAVTERERSYGIIPAYAGSTSLSRNWESPRADHPRIRGEHLPQGGKLTISCGSSPHTRGARGVVHGHRRPVLDHPRIRGEHHAGASMCTSASGSSPHTRGAPRAPTCG